MHSALIPSKRFKKSDGAARVFGLDCREWLIESATLSSVSAANISTYAGTSVTPLVVAGQEANDAIHAYPGCGSSEEVPVGQAILATYSGGTSGCTYLVVFPYVDSDGNIDEAPVLVEM